MDDDEICGRAMMFTEEEEEKFQIFPTYFINPIISSYCIGEIAMCALCGYTCCELL
jgi:hypothetical protein